MGDPGRAWYTNLLDSMAIKARSSNEFTLRDLWQSIIPRLGRAESPSVPPWPPDVFALCSYSLRQAAAYVHVLSNWPPHQTARPQWNECCEAVAAEWQKAITVEQPALPRAILQCWSKITEGFDRPLSELRNPISRVAQAIVELMAYSDQTCRPLAAPPNEVAALTPFDSEALTQLQKHGW